MYAFLPVSAPAVLTLTAFLMWLSKLETSRDGRRARKLSLPIVTADNNYWTGFMLLVDWRIGIFGRPAFHLVSRSSAGATIGRQTEASSAQSIDGDGVTAVFSLLKVPV